jgi:hypothetical protein
MGGCAEAFGGSLYFGTLDGRVCINDGYLDGVMRDGTGGASVDFSCITAFSDLGRPTMKRVQFLRPTFLSQGAPPQYTVQPRYRWDLTEAVAPPSAGATGLPSWDTTGKWDQSNWAGSYMAQQGVFGGQGCGSQVALAIRGSATARMTLVSVDVAYDEGGIL